MPRRSLLVLALVALTGLLGPAASAGAATVRAADAVARECQPRLLGAGTDGVAVERYTAERSGVVTVELRGEGGDWDLGLFSAGGAPDTGSASFGASERAEAFLQAGDTLVAQACRRTGDGATATLRFRHFPATAPQGPDNARLVEVPLAVPENRQRLEATGLDVTHDVDSDSAKVVLYGAGDARRLGQAGFSFRPLVNDLRAADALRARADARFARSVARSALPSGRTSYRLYADYGNDLKQLAADHPGLVRPVTIGTSLEGRPIEGIEIADAVDRVDDGRPVFAVLGLHHAREWPSGEMPMELATDLARGFAGNARIRRLLGRVRVLVLPMINPDGFVVSRSANGGVTGPQDEDSRLTIGQIVNDQGAYKRKNCRPTLNDANVPCAMRTNSGVDLNRNYGAFWGGVGASTDPTMQGYRGTGPFSEPESEAFHRVSQTTPITTVISHHTFTREGTWLRQPGFCQTPPDGCQSPYPDDQPRDDVTDERQPVPEGPYDLSPDEAGMKALGDAMGQASGWLSQLGWVIGEITGATEDWNYFAASAYGYTPEQRGTNFHPNYARAVVAEYDGTAPGAAGGVRESLLRAAEQAADPRFHSVLEGSAPAGNVLRLVKAFATATSEPGRVVDDRLDLRTVVPAGGRFSWHVNPSTRPLAAGREAYTLRCERPDGTLVAERAVVVDRGQRLDLGDACVAGRETVSGPAPLPPTGTPATRRRRPVLVISRSAVRARTINRRRRMTVALRVDGTLRNLRARFVDRRNRSYLVGSLRTLSRDRRLTLRRVRIRGRVLRAGRYRVVATAIGRDGIAVRATRTVRVRR